MIESIVVISAGIIVFCIGFYCEYAAYRTFDWTYLKYVDLAYPISIALCVLGGLIGLASLLW